MIVELLKLYNIRTFRKNKSGMLFTAVKLHLRLVFQKAQKPLKSKMYFKFHGKLLILFLFSHYQHILECQKFEKYIKENVPANKIAEKL